MEVKAGYKKTEVGVIPEDWSAINIGNLLEFKNGLNKAKEFFGKGTPIVNYMDIFCNPGLLKQDVKGKVTLTEDEIRNYRVKKGDVFFTRTSETVDEIGMSSVMLENMKETVFSGFVLRGRPKNNKLILLYKQYCFRTKEVRKQICSTSSYTTRALTNGKLLSNVYIPVPPTLPEQKAIAEVLSDTDNLIQALEKRIAKKRLIKHFYSVENVTKNDFKNTKFISESEHTFLTKNWKIEKGDVLMTRIGSIGDCKFIDWNVTASFYVSLALLKMKKGFSGQFLSHYSTSDFFKKEIEINSLLSAIPKKINLGQISNVKVIIPLDYEEQTRIATILSDMDVEIEISEKKLAKYKHLKQGLMQNLLIGKIRLNYS
jgi:type I restriction enzyme S subunit